MAADRCHWCNNPYTRAQEPFEGYCSRKCYAEDPNSVDIRARVTGQRRGEAIGTVIVLCAAFFLFFMTR